MTAQLMTPELLKMALPKNLHGNATPQFAATINQLALEPETCEEVRSNFLTYSKVLVDGKYKTQDYLNAVIYCTHKFMGYSNKDAYARSFPDRYQSLAARGATEKDISAYVSAYSKNQLVNQILEQALIPAHLLHQDVFNQAIKTQVELMQSSPSDKVRQDAANSILTHLKAPEKKKIELDVTVKQTGGIDDLRQTMEALAKQQVELIAAGATTAKDMARAPLMLTKEQKEAAIEIINNSEFEPAELASVDEPFLDPIYQGLDSADPVSDLEKIGAAPEPAPAVDLGVPDPDPNWMRATTPDGPPRGVTPDSFGSATTPARGASIFDAPAAAPTPAPVPKPRVSLFGEN